VSQLPAVSINQGPPVILMIVVSTQDERRRSDPQDPTRTGA